MHAENCTSHLSKHHPGQDIEHFCILLPLRKGLPYASSQSFPHTETTILTFASRTWFCLVLNFIYTEPHSPSPLIPHTPPTLWDSSRGCCPPLLCSTASHCQPGQPIFLSCNWPSGMFPLWGSYKYYCYEDHCINHTGMNTTVHIFVGYCVSFLLLLKQITTKFSA